MQEIEIECKNLLTQAEFERLLTALPFPTEAQVQTNYYFETADFQLKQHSSALRIREKNGHFRLTLKEPHGDGLVETHDELSEAETTNWLAGNPTSKQNTAERLSNMGIDINQLVYYGSLTTKRREFEQGGLLFVLDESNYGTKTDYELEIEAPDKASGQLAMQQILHDYHIAVKSTPNKIQRFFSVLRKH
ncbi:CYTH domain-containing protein [Virgibacillus sp. 179-BFC.A HS]|uniref:CYTH domain-containing protein n=1 Tax=Tigheibacillus jepli TaxID=3035914 RepID=A0ABU5CII6_9BACI|nr:CYTH domain-containing protein [Virgibacillus sp. 179-BFC.A HS]MDY0406168.1 CYTH domain-containing protein [Virgibacillus sp. 179-BFC.A HS]